MIPIITIQTSIKTTIMILLLSRPSLAAEEQHRGREGVPGGPPRPAVPDDGQDRAEGQGGGDERGRLREPG